MPLPALLTIQSGISKLRYATLMGIKKAKTKEIRRVAVQRPAAAAAALRCRSTGSTCRRGRKKRTCSRGAPSEAAAKLAEVLQFEVRVL